MCGWKRIGHDILRDLTKPITYALHPNPNPIKIKNKNKNKNKKQPNAHSHSVTRLGLAQMRGLTDVSAHLVKKKIHRDLSL